MEKVSHKQFAKELGKSAFTIFYSSPDFNGKKIVKKFDLDWDSKKVTAYELELFILLIFLTYKGFEFRLRHTKQPAGDVVNKEIFQGVVNEFFNTIVSDLRRLRIRGLDENSFKKLLDVRFTYYADIISSGRVKAKEGPISKGSIESIINEWSSKFCLLMGETKAPFQENITAFVANAFATSLNASQEIFSKLQLQ